MKKKILVVTTISLITISAISIFVLYQKNTNNEKDADQAFVNVDNESDFTIVFSDKLAKYSIENGKLNKLTERPVKISEDRNLDFVAFGNKILFSAGHASSLNSAFSIGIIDRVTGDYKEVEREILPPTGIGYDDTYFYTMTSINGAGTQIQQFDLSGTKLNENSIEEESVGIKILGLNNKIYMLAGVEKKEYHDVFYVGTVSVFDQKTLAFEREYILQDIDSDYIRGLTDMEIIGNSLYLPNTRERNKQTQESKMSSEILVFNLDTQQTDFISLEENYPTGISKDKSEENLLVFHEPSMLEKYVLSIYNLKTGIVNTIELKELSADFEEYIPFDYNTTEDGYLLLMTDKSLILYNMEKQQVEDILQLEDSEINNGLRIIS